MHHPGVWRTKTSPGMVSMRHAELPLAGLQCLLRKLLFVHVDYQGVPAADPASFVARRLCSKAEPAKFAIEATPTINRLERLAGGNEQIVCGPQSLRRVHLGGSIPAQSNSAGSVSPMPR